MTESSHIEEKQGEHQRQQSAWIFYRIRYTGSLPKNGMKWVFSTTWFKLDWTWLGSTPLLHVSTGDRTWYLVLCFRITSIKGLSERSWY